MLFDLIGERFGKLTVKAQAETRNQRRHWLCLCDCGKETIVKTSDLTSGNTKSCGCQKYSSSIANLKNAKKPVIDITGQRFGRLVVKHQVPSDKPTAQWLCVCDCGKEKIADGCLLRSGVVRSCGCLAKETQRRIGASSKGRPSNRMIDLTGQTIGFLKILERDTSCSKYVKWHCVCVCGKRISVSTAHLRSGHTISCGCKGLEHATQAKIKHSGSGTALFAVLNGMKTRCENPNSTAYKWYGAKGVKVCPEWKDFAVFRDWAMSHGYKQGLTIDRIDPDGDYCPDNCRWITRSENSKRVQHK